MRNLLLVMLGGAVGSGLRYLIGRAALAQWGAAFPWGTWIVNLSGGFFAGLLVGTLARGQSDQSLALLLGVGLLGGFTTFSAFSVETAGMIERGEVLVAGAYAVSSVAGALMMLFVGLWLTRAIA